MMTRHKNYICTCLECGRSFTATRNDAKFDTGACKAKWSREHRKNLIKSQAETIKIQDKILSKVFPALGPEVTKEIIQDLSWWEKEKLRKEKYDVWLDKVLSGIIFPSISKYRAGKFSEYEIKEFTKTANEQGMTLSQYMEDLERRLINAHPDIAKQFE